MDTAGYYLAWLVLGVLTAWICWCVWQETPDKSKLRNACLIGLAVAALVAFVQPAVGKLFGKIYPPSSFFNRWGLWTFCFTLLGGGLYLKAKDPNDPSKRR